MMFGRIRSRRGAGNIGCLLLMAIVAASVYAGFQYAMPKLRYSSFSDRLNESVYHFQRQPEDAIRRQIIDMAAEFDIALTPEQVKVSSVTNKLTIELSYQKVLDLKVWQTTLPFELRRSVTY